MAFRTGQQIYIKDGTRLEKFTRGHIFKKSKTCDDLYIVLVNGEKDFVHAEHIMPFDSNPEQSDTTPEEMERVKEILKEIKALNVEMNKLLQKDKVID